MNQLKKEFTVAFQLSSVSRYSRDHLLKPESVLEHVGFCLVYGALFSDRLEAKGLYVNRLELFRKIAYHDIDEAILGDIPRTTKYFSEDIRGAMKKVEKDTVARLDVWLKSFIRLPWLTAKEGFEGSILKVVDLAAVVYKNWTEVVLLRNRSFLRVCVETQRYLDELEVFRFHPAVWLEIKELKELNKEILDTFVPTEEDMMFIRMQEAENVKI
jgi:5'-deoxynucleotidase YfbR-like HD superfamily hydrolase